MNTRLKAAGFLPSLSKTPGGLLDCASPPSILPFCKMLFAKRLPDKPFRAAGYWIRELRFAAACGRRRQSAVSTAAPLAGRSKAGPPMALRQGEQGALPPRAPPLLFPLALPPLTCPFTQKTGCQKGVQSRETTGFERPFSVHTA